MDILLPSSEALKRHHFNLHVVMKHTNKINNQNCGIRLFTHLNDRTTNDQYNYDIIVDTRYNVHCFNT